MQVGLGGVKLGSEVLELPRVDLLDLPVVDPDLVGHLVEHFGGALELFVQRSVHHLEALGDLFLEVFDGEGPGPVAELAVDVGDGGDGEQVEGDLADVVAQELPALLGVGVAVVVVGLVAEVVLVVLEGDDVGEVLPALQQHHQLLAHLDAVLAANDQDVDAALLDLLGELRDLHGVRADAVVLADVDQPGGRTVDGQDQEEHLALVVYLVRTQVAQRAGV